MYLTEPTLLDIVKKQFRYKLNAYTGIFSSLLIMQIIGILFGIQSSTSSSSGYDNTILTTWITASGNTTVAFTLIWAFSMGILTTTMAYRHDAFSFVTTRLSHNLSGALFLLFASFIAGVTASLAGSLIKFISYFRYDLIATDPSGFMASPYDFIIRIATSILYTCLLAILGFLIGSFIQRSKLVIPLLILGLIVVPTISFNIDGISIIGKIVSFFGSETSFLLFILKVLLTIPILLATAIAITNKVEVRK